ncbi:ribosomal proteins l2, RNA binding domain-containing protein [Ditylenchus destructor]|uniref:Ribosomal proteins l2, RNA binding domain-containing protein n=1 Tax=Ditylenchus destructor TaxID=166010 RepID=A0AAD4MFR9_9BILA|nr:ribosomal proteins l2, RNA binding domain-containing protein [Ditylenchus destructor]
MNVLVAPVVSEKATMVGEKSNAVTFKVLQDATKPEIKAAVELMFKVEVKGVSVLNTKGKTKRFGKSVGRRDNVRKAYMKPTSPGQRGAVKISRDHLHKGAPHAALLEPQFQKAGRNNNGHITIRHRGGGAKHHYRVVDFRAQQDGIPAKVDRIEYDPNRTAHIALVCYADGERPYIIAPRGLEAGATLLSGAEAPIRAGNTLPIRNIPVGSTIHCIELQPARARRSPARPVPGHAAGREGVYAQVRMRSGEVRRIPHRMPRDHR